MSDVEVFDTLPPKGGRGASSDRVSALALPREHPGKWVVVEECESPVDAGKSAQLFKQLQSGKLDAESWDFASRTLMETEGNRYVVLGKVEVGDAETR